jgi:hypothetical protein
VTPAGGSRWQSVDGKITLDTSTSAAERGPRRDLREGDRGQSEQPGRKITYKLLRPDFFVVTGETPTGKFYRRLAAGPQGLRGFSIGYDKALAPVSTSSSLRSPAASSRSRPDRCRPHPSVAGTAIAGAGLRRAAGCPDRALWRRARPQRTRSRSPRSRRSMAVALRVGGRNAKLRLKDDASGLALLDLDGGGWRAAGVRSEALGEREAWCWSRSAMIAASAPPMALPGQGVRNAGGSAVFAPLQPGQSGSPVFDRQGRLAGLVTANPSDKFLIAGVAPQRAYAVADGAAFRRC